VLVNGALQFAEIAIGAPIQFDNRILDGDELQPVAVRDGDPDRNAGIFDNLLFHNGFPARALRGLKNNVSIEGFSACAASHSTGAFEAIARRHAQRGFMPRAGGMMENNTHFANLLVGNGFRCESLACFQCVGFSPSRAKVGARRSSVNGFREKNKI
jgi:hypothetical protein